MADWPISRYQVRLALSRTGLTPLRKPHDIILIDGDAKYEWCRFIVPFSRLVCEGLPMLIDTRTGQYTDDKTRILHNIGRAFTEPVSDIEVAREYKRFVATFTIYVASDRGRKTWEQRKAHLDLKWSSVIGLFY